MDIKRIIGAILCAAVLFSLFGCSKGPSEETTKAEETTKEPVSDTTQGDDVDTAKTYTVPLSRRTDGKLTWEYTYSPDGMSLSKTDHTEDPPITYTVTFDESGRPLYTEWTVVVNDTRTELWRDEYDEFDSEGRITLERRYCEGEIQNAFAYTYDSEGRMETQTTRNVKQQNTTYRLLYDSMGTHIGTRYKKYNGEAGYYQAEKICTYDSEGRLLTKKSADVTETHEYILDGSLVVGERIKSESAGYHWSYYYTYKYEKNKLIRKDCSFEGMITDSEEYTETEFEHYLDAVNWIFRERLP